MPGRCRGGAGGVPGRWEAVTDKVQSRTLRLGLYASNGELISDVQELTFDFRSENPQERELIGCTSW